MQICNKAILIFLMAAFSKPLQAQIKLPAIISDNMILQQNTKVALWGWAAPNETITIAANWNKRKTSVTA